MRPATVALLVAALLLAWSAALVPSLPASTGLRAVVGAVGALVLVLVARGSGTGWRDLGLGRAEARRGLRWGAAAATVASAGWVLVLLVAPDALDEADEGQLLLRALVLIPLGTVLAEELAFRGVLHARLRQALPRAGAVVVGGVVFGLWHLGTALRRDEPVAGVLLATGLGGVVLGVLRERSGSLLAPVGLHLGVNVGGLLAAAAADG